MKQVLPRNLSTMRHQCYLNNVIRTHLVEINGSLTTLYLQNFIGSFFENLFFPKEGFQCFPVSHETFTALPLWKHVISRILVIKFRPKARCQTAGLMKWSDRKGDWVVPSLSYNLQKFIDSSFKIFLSWKKCPSVWISAGWCHVALRQLLRLSNVLANRSFCRSHISKVQLKSKWTVGERLQASDPEAVR